MADSEARIDELWSVEQFKGLSAEELGDLLFDHVPFSLVATIKRKDIDGDTFVLFEEKDVDIELSDTTIKERLAMKSIIRQVHTVPVTRRLSTASSDSLDDTLSIHSSSDDSLVEKSGFQSHSFLQEFKALDLPNDFQLLTYFGKEKTKVLKENKDPATVPENIRNVVIEQVGQQLFVENEKPSKATLEWVAYTLCKSYPGLQDLDPRVTARKVDPNFKLNEKHKFIPWEHLRKQLGRKLENLRQKDKRLSVGGSDQPAPKKKRSSEDLTDDETAMKRHYDLLHTEMQKRSPDHSVVQALMKKTFKLRRKECKEKHASKRVNEMMSIYPCLKWINQIKQEFVWVLHTEYKTTISFQELYQNFENQAKKLKAYARELAYLELNDSEEQDEVQDITDSELLKVLPDILGVKKQHLIFKKANSVNLTGQPDKQMLTPYLLVHGETEISQLFIMHNNTVIAEIPQDEQLIGTALILLVGVYYIFNFEYPKDCVPMFMFLQQFILNLPPSHEPSSYMKIRNKYLLFVNSHF